MAIMKNLVVFDFETSGLDPVKDRVIELAAIEISNGVVVREFSTIINAGVEITPEITRITGITQDQVNEGMEETLAFKILNKFIGNNILVAHNAGFDMQFLHHTYQRIAGTTFNNYFIDTLTISRDRHFYPHKLEDMCAKYEINLEGAHRALNDVHGCYQLLQKLHEEEPIDTFVNKLGYLKKYNPPAWAPAYADLLPMENRYDNSKKKFLW